MHLQKFNRKNKKVHRRYYLLLEVLIAAALIAISIFPLVYPQIKIFREEKQFVETIDLKIAVQKLLSHLVENMYQQEISWEEIETRKQHFINEFDLAELLDITSFPYRASFQFKKARLEKKDQTKNPTLFLYLTPIEITFEHIKNGKEHSFSFELLIRRDLKQT